MDRWNRFDEIIGKVEQFFLTTLLSLMILLGFSQILLRNFFSMGLSWGDPLIRYMVLWVAFIGAALAAKEDKHIKIDLIARWMPGLANEIIRVFTNAVSSFICGLLVFAALRFVHNEAMIGGIAFIGIPAWVLQLVIPISFGVMSLRFACRTFKELSNMVKSGRNQGQEQKGER